MSPNTKKEPKIIEINKVNPNIKDLKKAFDNDLELMLFYLTWIKCGLNAGAAYRELHPKVTEHSSRTLGSKQLAKIDKTLVMEAYGLNHEAYFRQLAQGLEAQKSDITGNVFPDHKTRSIYHDKLGKLLGIESNSTLGVELKDGEKSIRFIVTRSSDS